MGFIPDPWVHWMSSMTSVARIVGQHGVGPGGLLESYPIGSGPGLGQQRSVRLAEVHCDDLYSHPDHPLSSAGKTRWHSAALPAIKIHITARYMSVKANNEVIALLMVNFIRN